MPAAKSPVRKTKPRNIYCANCRAQINHYHRVDQCLEDCSIKFDDGCCDHQVAAYAQGREGVFFRPIREGGLVHFFNEHLRRKPCDGPRGPRILLEAELRRHGIEYGGDCLRCLKCQKTWSDIMAKPRWLRSGWWKCPAGCNVPEPAAAV